MAWSTVVKLCLIVILCFTIVDYVNAQGKISSLVDKRNKRLRNKQNSNCYWHVGRGGGSSSTSNLKLKEEVEFLKANLSALWDIVSVLQTRAAEERQDESEELVVSLGLKRKETWGPNMKNIFDSQVNYGC